MCKERVKLFHSTEFSSAVHEIPIGQLDKLKFEAIEALTDL
jgi:hypothetical protein